LSEAATNSLRRRTAGLLLYVWRQDHNGFSHQGHRFIDHVVNREADITSEV